MSSTILCQRKHGSKWFRSIVLGEEFYSSEGTLPQMFPVLCVGGKSSSRRAGLYRNADSPNRSPRFRRTTRSTGSMSHFDTSDDMITRKPQACILLMRTFFPNSREDVREQVFTMLTTSALSSREELAAEIDRSNPESQFYHRARKH